MKLAFGSIEEMCLSIQTSWWRGENLGPGVHSQESVLSQNLSQGSKEWSKWSYSMVGQAELSPPPLVAENVVGVNKELKKIKNHISEKG